MSSRPKSVYRGKRRYRWIISLIVLILAAVVFAGVWLFYALQKYVVYEKDGVRLVLPFMQDESQSFPEADGEDKTPAVTLSPGDVEIVIKQPDFSDVETAAGEDIEDIYGYYLPASGVNNANILYQASRSGVNAMFMELKASDGYYAYKSGVPLAEAYGVNGSEDIAEALSKAKEYGVHIAAEISCLVDTAMAQRNLPLAVRSSVTGRVYEDGKGAYLDPYNKEVRAYIAELMAELKTLGIDEVILTGVLHPNTDDVNYSQAMTGRLDRVQCISAFALSMAEEARELGLKVSVKCDSAALHTGTMKDLGQDLEFFFRVFDRVYFETSSDYYESDIAAMESALGETLTRRIVPIIAQNAPEWGSYVIR